MRTPQAPEMRGVRRCEKIAFGARLDRCCVCVPALHAVRANPVESDNFYRCVECQSSSVTRETAPTDSSSWNASESSACCSRARRNPRRFSIFVRRSNLEVSRDCSGLAFHPAYDGNGRFFVFYTQLNDGTLVIAEYTVSGNPNVANTTETRILTIPHPTNTNHNGGVLAFGPDGYLYIGVGDGGSANDPPNNAQNLDVLLGKILNQYQSTDWIGSVPYRRQITLSSVQLPDGTRSSRSAWRNP